MLRRPLAAALLAAAAAAVVVPSAAATTAEDRVQVILLSVDALHPDEVDLTDDSGAAVAPTLQRLRDEGTWWTQARAIMASETLPNHVAMATGTYAGFHGVPGNDGRLRVGDSEPADPDLGLREAREATSTIAAIETQCPDLETLTVLSKQYVWRTFVGEADADFDQPSANLRGSGHAPELATVPYLLQQLQDRRIDHAFVNLGDHDRGGHVDQTGALPDGPTGVMDGPRAGQQAALADADSALATIVAQLESSGAWSSTVLLLVSDHSMRFTIGADPRFNVDIGGALEAVEVTEGREPGSTFLHSVNGAAGFVYLLDPDEPEAGRLLTLAHDAIAALAGVGEVLYRLPNADDPDGQALSSVHPSWNLHQTERAGDIVVLAADRYRIGSLDENPVPGVHGDVLTRHSTALVTGGWDGIVAGQVIDVDDASLIDPTDDTTVFPGQAENVDWAPTVGWLLGVTDPGTSAAGDPQWQGRVLTEAFSRRPAVLPCAVAAGSSATDGGVGDPDDAAGADDGGSLADTGGGAALLGVALLGVLAVLRPRRRSG